MRKGMQKALCAIALIPLLLSGCWQEDLPAEEDTALLPAESSAEVAQAGAHLPECFSLPYAPAQTLDPISCPDGMQQTVASLLYEGLFRLDSHIEPQNLLCGSYTYDAEKPQYVFTLRPGVTFSDGTALTAADVKSTLDRARTSERYGARLAAVTSVSARDDTVTVTLSAPNTGFPALLDIPIVKKGTENSAVPTGTGPYFFSQEEGGAYLIANQSWWQQKERPTERIALEETSSHDAMLYRFTSHDLQLITADLTGTLPVSVTGNVACHDAETTVLQYVGINTARDGLSDPALRRALSQGINRGSIVSAYLSGHGVAAQFPVSPVSPLYPSQLETAYSHDGFTAALAETQLPERTLTLLVNGENSFKVSIASHLAETFTEEGLSVETRVLPWADYTAALAAGDFDLYYGEVRLTADWDLSPLLATGGTLNYGGWSDAQTDHLLTLYASAAERGDAMERLCTRLKNQAPILPVCFKSVSILTQADVVEGLSPTMAEPFYDLSACVIHLKEG